MGLTEVLIGVAFVPLAFVLGKFAASMSDTKSGFGLTIIVALVLLFGGSGVNLYDASRSHWLDGLQKISADIVGDVIDNTTTTERNGVTTTTHSYAVNYSYTVAGVAYSASGTMFINPGGESQIDAYYDPARPAKSVLDIDSARSDLWVRNIIAGLAGAGALVMLLVGWWRYTKS